VRLMALVRGDSRVLWRRQGVRAAGLTRKLFGMAPRREIEAPCAWQILAARALYRERMATSVASIGAAEAAFKDAVLAFADEPSPQNAGRYLAASERLTASSR
jgi:hypothetical protein